MTDVPGWQVSPRWIEWRRTVDLLKYDERFALMAERGDSIHGEADFIERLFPQRKISLLDAGCGTGRLAIEMTSRGHHAVGVDLDPDMIARARSKAPDIVWHVADLSKLALGSKSEVVVMAGNIPLFCSPESQAAIIKSLSQHVVVGGFLITGFSLEDRGDAYLGADYQRDALAAGLTFVAEYSNWNGDGSITGNDYTVMVHQLH